MFLYVMKSQKFVFLNFWVSCSCEECKTCFFTYHRTQEYMYAHQETVPEEAKACILGNYFSKAFRETLRYTAFHFHHPPHADHVLLLLLTFALQFGSSLCHCVLCSAHMVSARAREMVAQGSAFDVADAVADPQLGTTYKARAIKVKSGPLAVSCLLLGSFATFVEWPIHHYGFKGSASSSCAAIIITITMRLLCYHHHHHHENNLLLPFVCASCLFINMCFCFEWGGAIRFKIH